VILWAVMTTVRSQRSTAIMTSGEEIVQWYVMEGGGTRNVATAI